MPTTKVELAFGKARKTDVIGKKWVTRQLQTASRQTPRGFRRWMPFRIQDQKPINRIAIDYLIVAAMLHALH